MSRAEVPYLGVRPEDLDAKPYARFWNPVLAALSPRAREAVLRGPVAPELLPGVDRVSALLAPGDSPLEDGYALMPDRSAHVAIKTEMPGATPAMVDWWFGWHGEEDTRYKLWHPQAHLRARWDAPVTDARTDRARYVGRTSRVTEYLGSELGRFAIRFVPPAELGFDEGALADASRATAVCARVGLAEVPLDAGYLVHHVRAVPGGAEMRSRFWLGGGNAAPRAGGALGSALVAVARRLRPPSREQAVDLLVHCAHEMAHLAGFLPALYAECGAECGAERGAERGP